MLNLQSEIERGYGVQGLPEMAGAIRTSSQSACGNKKSEESKESKESKESR